jgi:hypothetical protein
MGLRTKQKEKKNPNRFRGGTDTTVNDGQALLSSPLSSLLFSSLLFSCEYKAQAAA